MKSTNKCSGAVAIEGLSERMVKACALVFGPERMSPDEVALRFGVSRWAIYKRVARARMKVESNGYALPARRSGRRRVRPASQFVRNQSIHGGLDMDSV